MMRAKLSKVRLLVIRLRSLLRSPYVCRYHGAEERNSPFDLAQRFCGRSTSGRRRSPVGSPTRGGEATAAHRVSASAITIGTMFVLGALLAGVASATPGNGNGNTPSADAYAIVEFTDSPVAAYAGGILGYPATQPLHGHKLDLASANIALYATYLNIRHASFQSWLKSNAPWAQVVREYSLAFNGVAIQTNGNSLNALANAPGVKDVTPDWIYYPSMDVSVPLIKANAVWSSLGINPTTGELGALADVKVGVIDTGI